MKAARRRSARQIAPQADEASTAPAEAGAGAQAESATRLSFHIVGIGASAGGLDAFEKFFSQMPPDSGLAYVIVSHLDPTHKSLMADLINNYTAMAVYQIEDQTAVEPNCVYIIPPNKDLSIFHGVLQLMEPAQPRGQRLPIDIFFRSLAEDQEENAVGIILSGTGTDGTLGVKAIKEHGGMVMAQEAQSSRYDGMPRSAIATGIIDYVEPVEQLPVRLLEYTRRPASARQIPRQPDSPVAESDQLSKIFLLLRSQTGHDFALYKRNTILRRIERRMHVHQVDEVADYVRFLQQSPTEIEALFRDLLISVTRFFRDPEACDALKHQVIPQMCSGRQDADEIRIWVPGCATGEEAYTLAILLAEYIGETRRNYKIQMFATDIDTHALDVARLGVYPQSIVADLTPERLRRFFVKQENTYQVNKTIRDMVVFAAHNVIKDPPFSHIDLISCRNVLIYFEQSLQKKVLPLFHYALEPNGFLMLGMSETIGELQQLFEPVDKKLKIFRRHAGYHSQMALSFPTAPEDRATSPRPPMPAVSQPLESDSSAMAKFAEKTLFQQYVPPSLIVDEYYNIVHIYGRVRPFLDMPSGKPTHHLLELARDGLRMELRTCIHMALREGQTVRRDGVKIAAEQGLQTVNITVQPLHYSGRQNRLVIVTFQDVEYEAMAPEAMEITSVEGNPIVSLLEQELKLTKERLQVTVDEYETSSQDLKSSNEELLSINEELQSTTEELETSKEEMQSINEELMTVNAELQNKVEELTQVNSDLDNLLMSTDIATIFLDINFCVRRFTPTISGLFKLIQTDIGRPLTDITHNLRHVDLNAEVEAVLNTLTPREKQVETLSGAFYLMRVLPYRAANNRIDGVVLTFVNITERRRVEARLSQAHSDLAFRAQELALANSDVIVDRLQSQLAIDISYQFRTYLNSILGFTGALEQGLPGAINDEQRNHLAMIHEAAQGLTDLVQDLTDLSTIKSQPADLDNEWFTMADVIAEVIEQHAPQLSRKSLEVVVEKTEPALQILSDRKRLRQAFMHLLTYAIQSSEQGRIRVTYVKRFSQLEVGILDVGHHVGANQLSRLEEALQQSGGPRAGEWDPYVGLYIYLARELIRLLGGRIDVSRAPERKIELKVTLPLTHS